MLIYYFTMLQLIFYASRIFFVAISEIEMIDWYVIANSSTLKKNITIHCDIFFSVSGFDFPLFCWSFCTFLGLLLQTPNNVNKRLAVFLVWTTQISIRWRRLVIFHWCFCLPAMISIKQTFCVNNVVKKSVSYYWIFYTIFSSVIYISLLFFWYNVCLLTKFTIWICRLVFS